MTQSSWTTLPDQPAIPGLHVLNEVGRGLHSVVYRAQRGSHIYAVKVPRSVGAVLADTVATQFRREASTLALVHHPSLPAVLEVGQTDTLPYLVMEYVAGRTLLAVLEQGRLPEARVVALATMLAGALAAVHRHGVTHRDVQPRNILVNENGNVTLIDFGFAAYSTPAVESGYVVGTLRYNAPEQSGMLKRPIDGRSDLYALGVILFECLVGAPPFTAALASELMRQHAVVPAPDVRHREPTVSPALAAIIARLLAKDPDDRYQTAEGLLSDLNQLSHLNNVIAAGGTIQLAADDFWTAALYEEALVGRDQELSVLRQCWNAARRSKGSLAIIAGGSGSGKSHLGRELLHRARSAGGLVLTSACLGESATPFATIRTAIEQYSRYLNHMPMTERLSAEATVQRIVAAYAPIMHRMFPHVESFLPTPAATVTPPDDQEGFSHMLAELLLWMTRVHPAAVWLLDDVQQIDDGSWTVLKWLLPRLAQSPLLVIATLDDQAASSSMHERLLDLVQDNYVHLPLAALDESAAQQLMSVYLGGYHVEPQLCNEIVARSAGSPFAIREYVQTMLDGGMVQLKNGAWLVDQARFARLQLPAQVLPLVLARVDGLHRQSQRVLQTAALLGFQFRRDILSMVWDGDTQDVNTALMVGTQAHLIERNASGTYQFSHQSVHDIFVHGLPEAEQAHLHGHIAHVLDHDATSIEQVYRLARHYALGDSRDPVTAQRAYVVSLLAGKLAVANFAYDEAYLFMRHASKLAASLEHALDPQTEAHFADVCYRTGHVSEALDHLSRAIGQTTDPYARATLRLQRCYINVWSHETASIAADVRQIFTDLDEPFATGTSANLLAAGRFAWRYLVATRLHLGGKRAHSRERERLIILEKLHELLGTVAYLSRDETLLVHMLFRSLYTSHRIGPSAELIRAHGNYAIIAAVLHRPAKVEHHLQLATTMAVQLNQRAASAHVALFRAIATHMLGHSREAERLMRECLESAGTALDPVEYSQGCNDIAWNLYVRGYGVEAWKWTERGIQRLGVNQLYATEALYLRIWAAPLLLAMGNPSQAQRYMVNATLLTHDHPHYVTRRNIFLCSKLIMLVEQGELGAELEEVLQQFQRSGANSPRRAVFHVRHFYVLQGYARLTQASNAPANQRSAALQRLAHAMKQLKATAAVPVLQGHYLVIKAGWQRLNAENASAMRTLGEAEALAFTCDSPWISYEVACQRGHLLAQQGQIAAAQREVRRAYDLAIEHRWVNRVQRLQREFTIDEQWFQSTAPPASESYQADTLKVQRHLDALLQVSLAWATVSDPDQQAQIALDAVIRILGAERAFFFLLDDDTMVFRAGRDANGNDLRSTEGCSHTLVERVRVSRQAVVISSTDDGAFKDIEHGVAQHLRSVVAAPLLLDGKLLGVVYLDNRLAWGMFAPSDVEILRAIANHIALGLETARAAQLETRIKTEQHQRRLAETLRTLLTVLNSSLNLTEVLDKTLSSIGELIPYDSACIALCHGDYFQFVALKGLSNSVELRHLQLPLAKDLLFAEMNTTHQPIIIPDTFKDPRFNGYGGNQPRSWLGAPLIVRDEVVGFLALDRKELNAISVDDAEIVTIFAAQAAIAIANARLFGEVQRLAMTDGLTNINTRRHFFELAEREWNRTRRYDHPLSAMMLDVDHFKRVNDTYGHATGDTVLHTVAQLCSTSLRDTDFIGRYGGEEFAILLPDTDLSAAHATAERLRDHIAKTGIATNHGQLFVTVSIGVASITVNTPSVASLLDRADRGLYIAKDTGRNRVIMA